MKIAKVESVRAIGLSDFEQADLDNILDDLAVKPMVNQILAHVSNTPFGLIDYTFPAFGQSNRANNAAVPSG